MKRSAASVAATIVFILISLVIAFIRPVHASPSYALGQTLGALRALGPASFGSVVLWARSGAPQVPSPVQDYELAEAQILNLNSSDRQAVLLWLQGSGRSALYARGATDDQIGPPRPGVDTSATPGPSATPNPWRDLKLASTSLGAESPAGNIVIIDGFAAAKRDGMGAIACASFKNIGTSTANRVVIVFTLRGADGNALAPLTLDRHGTFSPNVEIHSYPTLDDWLSPGFVNRGYADGCASIARGIAALPILKARLATYEVTRVEYADGTVWIAGSPAPTASP